MPKVEFDQLTKLYYSIGEVAEMFEVNTSLIRFWEKEFPQINPKKNKKGNRLFTVKEIKKIDQIYSLVKEQGFTLDGARKVMKGGVKIPQLPSDDETTARSEESAPEPNEDLVNRLEEIRTKLLRLKR